MAEVAARFTLDAMPGKQMAIDADLNAGLIDEQQVKQQREDISREADFYGAMTVREVCPRRCRGRNPDYDCHIIGGFAIGVLQRDLSLAEALQTYALLTVGDGLSQIPPLLLLLQPVLSLRAPR